MQRTTRAPMPALGVTQEGKERRVEEAQKNERKARKQTRPVGGTGPVSAAGDGALAYMSRRSRKNVATVVGTDAGSAACADHIDLFGRVEHSEGAVSHRDQLSAAAVSRGCPLFTTCGFRITTSGRRGRSGGGQ